MSRLESGTLKPKLDWCDIEELVNNSVEKVNTLNTHQVIFEQADVLPLFKLDIGFTEQILLNLLHNAVQYTEAGTTVWVKVIHEHNDCVIYISDDGHGFSANEIALAFNKFYRIPNTKAGGSGLGLSIVKGFTEALNGAITLDNNVGGGARFTIRIPAEVSYLNNLKNE